MWASGNWAFLSPVTHLFLKSSTVSCIPLSSESRRPLSPVILSSCLLRLLMYCSNKGSRFCLTVLVPCSCSRVHLVSRTLFCCSRNRTCRKIRWLSVSWQVPRPVWWSGGAGMFQSLYRGSSWQFWSPKFLASHHTGLMAEFPQWAVRCSFPFNSGDICQWLFTFLSFFLISTITDVI